MAVEQKKEIRVAKNRSVGAGKGAEPRAGASKKLASMPLSVLLPQLGELSDVLAFADEYEARLQELQSIAAAPTNEESDAETRRRRAIEESMLNQAIQWISIQTNR